MPVDVSAALGAGYSPEEITQFLAANPSRSPLDVTAAMKAGYSPAEIVDYLNPNVARQSEQGVPILAPIQRGIAHAQEGVASLVGDLGFTGAAADLRSRIPQADLDAKQSGQSLAEDIKAGNLGAALSDVPSAALEQTLPIAAGIATGALTGGAGPVAALGGRLAGGAAIGAATQGDAIARARAANNGEVAPSGADLAIGLGGGAAIGAAGSVGLGGVGKGLGGAIAGAAEHAAGDAAQPEMAALAGSVGTTAGAQNASPSDMEAAALIGAVSRAGLAGPDVLKATADLTPGARQAAAAETYASLPADQQNHLQNLAAAKGLIDQEQANAVPGGDRGTKAAANTAADRLMSDVDDLKSSLDDQGLLDSKAASAIDATMATARNPQRTLGQEDLDALDKLGLDAQTTTTLKNTAAQLNILSDPDVASRGSSPIMEAAGKLIGRAVGLGAGLHLGHDFLGWEAGRVAGALGQKLGAQIADKLGIGGSDTFAQQAGDAQAMLNAAGVSVPNTRNDLASVVAYRQSAIDLQSRLLGLTPNNTPVAPLPATPQSLQAMQALEGQQRADTTNGVMGQVTDYLSRQGQLQVPSGAPDVVQNAIIRAQTQGVANGPQGGPQAAPTPLRVGQQPVGLDGTPGASQGRPEALSFGPLPEAAMRQAARLPEWKYGLGAALQDALVKSGRPRAVNMDAEVNQALDGLATKGWLTPDMVNGLKGHQGRVVPLIYNLIRNEALLRNGIDRTHNTNPVAPNLAQATE